eukprot:GCRY01006964.1.p1 GENE.GCRY01006964.1~~GCRY01006964.1.p1  ORF type:complete len:232 (-),score=5.44 GCRY01006964.1:139-747(-)
MELENILFQENHSFQLFRECWQSMLERYRKQNPAPRNSTRENLIKKLEELCLEILQEVITTKETSSFRIYSRSANANVVWNDGFEIFLMLYENKTNVNALNPIQTQHFAHLLYLTEVVLTLLRNNQHATKRDIYYMNTSLFQKQSAVDQAVEDLACLLQVTRVDLHVIAPPRGYVYGPLSFFDTAADVRVSCSNASRTVHSS